MPPKRTKRGAPGNARDTTSAPDYSTLKIVGLRKELKKRGLKQHGSKAELVSRLQSNDQLEAAADEDDEPPAPKSKRAKGNNEPAQDPASTLLSLGTLSKLPGEIRNQIYHDTLTFPRPIDITAPNPIAGLLRASKTIRQEVMPHIFWQENTFLFPIEDGDSSTVPNWAQTVEWARRLTDTSRNDIQTIELKLKCGTRVEMWDAVVKALAEGCKGIRKVKISIGTEVTGQQGLFRATWWPSYHRSVWNGLEGFENLREVDVVAFQDRKWMKKFRLLHPGIRMRLVDADGVDLEQQSDG